MSKNLHSRHRQHHRKASYSSQAAEESKCNNDGDEDVFIFDHGLHQSVHPIIDDIYPNSSMMSSTPNTVTTTTTKEQQELRKNISTTATKSYQQHQEPLEVSFEEEESEYDSDDGVYVYPILPVQTVSDVTDDTVFSCMEREFDMMDLDEEVADYGMLYHQQAGNPFEEKKEEVFPYVDQKMEMGISEEAALPTRDEEKQPQKNAIMEETTMATIPLQPPQPPPSLPRSISTNSKQKASYCNIPNQSMDECCLHAKTIYNGLFKTTSASETTSNSHPKEICVEKTAAHCASFFPRAVSFTTATVMSGFSNKNEETGSFESCLTGSDSKSRQQQQMEGVALVKVTSQSQLTITASHSQSSRVKCVQKSQKSNDNNNNNNNRPKHPFENPQNSTVCTIKPITTHTCTSHRCVFVRRNGDR
mmetsp:Transcript_29347/g.35754  ORF Transcript_29347/g.35754 Transcript_29347/m.35754 type:complete len:418 (+) Transcript_29347:64-1317(+)